ncbi:Spc98 family-domain-containing protein [Daldinia bambusicola]|nr:Spc98 family-domain-containing protein [Daldinia bambusicola]
MAHAATLGALTDELVEAITSTSSQVDPERFNVLRESSLRKLRQHSFLRTNQFEVQDKLNGFEEHFRIVNKDGLADALRERLDALPQVSSKWTPEILHLLLLLEDQPVKKSKLADLRLLKERDENPEPPLRWEDIAKEEGWDQDGNLWKTVKLDSYSSEEEYLESASDLSSNAEVTSASTVEAQYQKSPSDFLIQSQEEEPLEQVRATQLWRNSSPSKDPTGRSHKIALSEFHIIREVLFALNGLENTLFDGQGVLSLQFQLKHTSWELYKALLGSFGEAGRQLSLLREFIKQPQNIPLLQVFREAVEERLRSFDREISDLQGRYVEIQQDVVISLARVLDDVKPHLEPLASLSEIIQQLQLSKYPRPFYYLELLFEAAELAQLGGNDAVYRFIATLFFECFHIYLRSIRLWMEAGELINDDKAFFITSSTSQVPLTQVWSNQFTLRKTTDGALYVPRFLRPAASKILTTGKSVVVLKLLGKYQSSNAQNIPDSPIGVNKDLISAHGIFAPFSEVFNNVFDTWMESKHHAASTTLRRTLFESCSLWSVLDALQQVYLMSNGAQSDLFTFAIFNNLDLLNSTWHDRFNLTAVAQETFGAITNAHRLVVTVTTDNLTDDVKNIRRSVRKGLPLVRILYRLSWPIRIILSDESLTQYEAVFTFLLQLRRATYVLHKYRLVSDNTAGTPNTSSDQATYYGLRTKLLWFCNTFRSYLDTLVLEPLSAELRRNLEKTEDIAAMEALHSAYTKQIISEVCLGTKLDPIRECILDMFDLAIRLQDARQLESEREQEEEQELSRLSVMSSPMKQSRRYMGSGEEEDETFLLDQDKTSMMQDKERPFAEVLHDIRADMDRHLKFICSGLRGVARASGDSAAGKWDILAEMFEAGVRDRR